MNTNNLKRRLLAAATGLLLLVSFAACGGNTATTSAPAASLAAAEQAATSEAGSETDAAESVADAGDAAAAPAQSSAVDLATDRAGNPIAVPETVDSIISMAPATTQVLLDLGLKESIVAVDEESAYMFAGELAEGVLVFEMMAPDVEQVMLLNADIAFVSAFTAAGGDDPLAVAIEAGLCVATIPSPTSIEGIFEDVRFIGACVGLETEAEALLAEVQQLIDEVAALAETVEAPRTVLFEISALPYIYSFGSGVYLDEILTLVGAQNVLAGQQDWLPLAEEEAVAANPDVILTNVNYIEDSVGEILAREGWQEVTAVANGDVYYIDNAASSLPNHHVAQAIREIAKAVYPQVYEAL